MPLYKLVMNYFVRALKPVLPIPIIMAVSKRLLWTQGSGLPWGQ